MAINTRNEIMESFSRIYFNSLSIIEKGLIRSILVGAFFLIFFAIIGSVLHEDEVGVLILSIFISAPIAYVVYLHIAGNHRKFIIIYNFIKGSRDHGNKVGGRDWGTLMLFERELSSGGKMSSVNIRRLVNEAAALMLLEENLKENKVFISHKDENIDYDESFLPLIEKTAAEFR